MHRIEGSPLSWSAEQLFQMGRGCIQVGECSLAVPANMKYLESRLGHSTKLMLIISGPSGVGKDHIVQKLEETGAFKRVVTHTDRNRRPGEIDGFDYHFVTPADFQAMRAAGAFFEAQPYDRGWKGIAMATVEIALAQHKIPIFRIDPKGAQTLTNMWQGKTAFQDYALVHYFIMAESEEALKSRLMERDSSHARIATLPNDLPGIASAHYVVVNGANKAPIAIGDICILTENLLRRMPHLTGQRHIC